MLATSELVRKRCFHLPLSELTLLFGTVILCNPLRYILVIKMPNAVVTDSMNVCLGESINIRENNLEYYIILSQYQYKFVGAYFCKIFAGNFDFVNGVLVLLYFCTCLHASIITIMT